MALPCLFHAKISAKMNEEYGEIKNNTGRLHIDDKSKTLKEIAGLAL